MMLHQITLTIRESLAQELFTSENKNNNKKEDILSEHITKKLLHNGNGAPEREKLRNYCFIEIEEKYPFLH